MSNLPDEQMTAHAGRAVGLEKVTGTEYVVLIEREAGGEVDGWREITTVQAFNPAAAIRAAIADDKTVNDRLVAVPARSWKPVRVTVETRSVIRLEDA